MKAFNVVKKSRRWRQSVPTKLWQLYTWRHIPDYRDLKTYNREKLTYHSVYVLNCLSRKQRFIFE